MSSLLIPCTITSTNVFFNIPQDGRQLIEVIQIVKIGASTRQFDTISWAEALSIFNGDNINIFVVQISQTCDIGSHNHGRCVGLNLRSIRDTTATIKWQRFSLVEKTTYIESSKIRFIQQTIHRKFCLPMKNHFNLFPLSVS